MVRRFNRYYTERVGVLSDRYLGQRRPLAEARVLFEIGANGRAVRDLRAELGLDTGYLARLLRSLEGQGLVATTTDRSDRRARTASLTRSGMRELDDLNARAEAATDELLSALAPREQDQLLAAMNTMYRLLRGADLSVEECDPDSPEVRGCLLAYAAELDTLFPEGFAISDLISAEEIRSNNGASVIAKDRGRPAGCGVLHELAPGVAEIRHLWISPGLRGIGLARRLLDALEQLALGRGMPTIRLDTHEVLAEAINLYRTSGYVEIAAYDENAHAHHWFEKHLATEKGPRP